MVDFARKIKDVIETLCGSSASRWQGERASSCACPPKVLSKPLTLPRSNARKAIFFVPSISRFPWTYSTVPAATPCLRVLRKVPSA